MIPPIIFYWGFCVTVGVGVEGCLTGCVAAFVFASFASFAAAAFASATFAAFAFASFAFASAFAAFSAFFFAF